MSKSAVTDRLDTLGYIHMGHVQTSIKGIIVYTHYGLRNNCILTSDDQCISRSLNNRITIVTRIIYRITACNTDGRKALTGNESIYAYAAHLCWDRDTGQRMTELERPVSNDGNTFGNNNFG